MSAPALKDYLHLHFIVLIWGFTAILGLLISIPAVELVFYRTLLAGLLLAVVVKVRGKHFALPAGHLAALLGTGALISAHWILFFAAARVANASVCLAGMATCSLWTALLEPLSSRKPVRLLEIFLGLLVVVGLYVIFHFEFDHALGLMLAVASAMLAAVFTIINSRFTHRYDSLVITGYEMGGAFLATALFLPFYRETLAAGSQLQLVPTAADWLYIALLAWLCTVYAYSAAVGLMQKFSAFAMNLTVNLEPVYGIVLAFLFFGEKEKMTTGFYLGTLVILLAVLAYPALNRLRTRKAVA
ncbi:MAG TPA: DMT family transporter [Cytophagales bacterium]